MTLSSKRSSTRSLPCQRPYHVEHTSSRPITEVKQHWGPDSTWMGDSLGTPGAVGFFILISSASAALCIFFGVQPTEVLLVEAVEMCGISPWATSNRPRASLYLNREQRLHSNFDGNRSKQLLYES